MLSVSMSSANISGRLHLTVPPLARHGMIPVRAPASSIRPLGIKSPVCVCSLSVAKETRSYGTEVERVLFEQYVKDTKKLIIAELDKAVPLRHPQRLHESMRHTLLSTRRCVVSGVCIAACQAVGGDVSQAMPLACACEMTCAMAMIHDDLPCMDDADIRRGQPANHKAFDEATALLAGDSLIYLAFEHLARHASIMSPEEFSQIVLDLSSNSGSEGAQAGQMMDKLCEGRDDVGLEELEYIHMHKTGKFIGSAAACGALLGGANKDEVERIRSIAKKTGFLMQVVNDIIDAIKTEEYTGRPFANDLEKGKLTYVKLLGIDGARRYSDQVLEDVLQELSYFDWDKSAPLRGIAIFTHNQQN